MERTAVVARLSIKWHQEFHILETFQSLQEGLNNSVESFWFSGGVFKRALIFFNKIDACDFKRISLINIGLLATWTFYIVL